MEVHLYLLIKYPRRDIESQSCVAHLGLDPPTLLPTSCLWRLSCYAAASVESMLIANHNTNHGNKNYNNYGASLINQGPREGMGSGDTGLLFHFSPKHKSQSNIYMCQAEVGHPSGNQPVLISCQAPFQSRIGPPLEV